MKQFLLSFFVFILFSACQKDQLCTDGVIRWGGEPAVDGLGWYFESADLPRIVKLKDIPSRYLTDSLAVSVCLIKTNEKYQCFCAEPMDVYEVKRIGKR
ncbi:hypothetical protein [Lacibacter sp. H407]|uniref:hypothetical protein n=1 Tax=Lacibacter sp. H407 TaxID=3133423 RepID=UPI0030BE183A